jgi:hypothetical protein
MHLHASLLLLYSMWHCYSFSNLGVAYSCWVVFKALLPSDGKLDLYYKNFLEIIKEKHWLHCIQKLIHKYRRPKKGGEGVRQKDYKSREVGTQNLKIFQGKEYVRQVKEDFLAWKTFWNL